MCMYILGGCPVRVASDSRVGRRDRTGWSNPPVLGEWGGAERRWKS